MWKNFMFSIVVLALMLLTAWFLIPLLPFEPKTKFYLLALCLTVFILFIGFLVQCHRPLRKVLKEMKALLAGRRYHRIYTAKIDEFGVLANFFNEITKNIERISKTVKEGERMSTELTIASDIQKMVLPAKLPEVPCLDIFANTRASVEIGGDNYDVIRSHNNTFIYVGDVTGHGVPAGLVMMMANTLLNTFCEMYQSAYDVVVQVNRILKPRIPSTMFMTMVMLRYHETEKKMYFTGCGHEHILTFKKASGVCEAYPSGGIALGMLPDNSKIIKEEILSFDAGDFIVLYSDGIIEAKNTNGEQFGLKRLKEAVEKYAPSSQSSKDLFTYVLTDFNKFVEDQTQDDDVTMMVIRKM